MVGWPPCFDLLAVQGCVICVVAAFGNGALCASCMVGQGGKMWACTCTQSEPGRGFACARGGEQGRQNACVHVYAVKARMGVCSCSGG